MTAAADDDADWVGIKRPGQPAHVIELAERPRPDLVKAIAQVRASRQDLIEDPELANAVRLADGELAALEWVVGERNVAPLTSRVDVDVADPWELDRERSLATDMLQLQAEMDRRGDRYVSGVESTLMWILGQTSMAPN